jgi:hypothetical protein
MAKFFDKFPVITYNGSPARNIFSRARFSEQTKNNPVNFVPHRLESSVLRPDVIAEKYYDSPYYDWLYYFSNEIVDPYYDVALTDELLSKKIIAKYGSISYARDLILFYRNNWVGANKITEAQYYLLPVAQRKYYTSAVDYFNNITGYERKKVDWVVSTNKVVNLTVDTVDFAEIDDIYLQYEEGNTTPVATAQLAAYSSDTLTMSFKNVTGAFVTSNNNVIVSKYRNTEFEYTASTINQTVLNITENEAQYWSAISAYDYETEENQKKKEIVLLRKSQKNKAEEQLTELLRS